MANTEDIKDSEGNLLYHKESFCGDLDKIEEGFFSHKYIQVPNFEIVLAHLEENSIPEEIKVGVKVDKNTQVGKMLKEKQ